MIYIIRHGETDGNNKGVLRGSYFDDELNAKGKSQAKMTAKMLKGIRFDLCFCSPLKRALQTAKPIFRGDIIMEHRIRPREYGELVGLDPEDVAVAGYYSREKNLTPKNGESFIDFENRIIAFLDDIKQKHPSKNILVVTHASICNMTKAIIDNHQSPRVNYLTKNCEIIKIPN